MIGSSATSAAAVEAHRKRGSFEALGRKMGGFIAGPPEIVRLPGVG